MDIKLQISLKHFNPSTVSFYNFIFEEKSKSDSSIGSHISLPNLQELFITIEHEFEELHTPSTLAGILKILDLAIRHTNSSPDVYLTFMNDLLSKYSTTEENHLIALQLLYQILSSLPNDFPAEEFNATGFVTRILQDSDFDSAKIETQLALCRELMIKKFKVDGLLERVWEQMLRENNSFRVLLHYIDSLLLDMKIYERSDFWQIIKVLLSSDISDDRKLGVFLVRKTLKFLSSTSKLVEVDGFFYWSDVLVEEQLSSWLTYLTILENFEEKQSHLILPSLETLDSVKLDSSTPWIRVLLLQMLKHNNSLVISWMVNYILRNFTKMILEKEILSEFFLATNNTWLYNEGASDSFILPALDQQLFLEKFAGIPWKSVPMHAWLQNMKTVRWDVVEPKLVISIATRLRQLQNRCIRGECRNLFTAMFETTIDAMDLVDFIGFLDAFFSSTDTLLNSLLGLLVRKIEISLQPFISSNLCAILRKQDIPIVYELTLMKAFDKLKVEKHKWFSILVRFGFDSSKEKQAFCQKHYDLHTIEHEGPNLRLSESMSEHVSKLSWDDVSAAVVREATVDLFTRKPELIKGSEFEDVLDAGGIETLINITRPVERSFTINKTLLYRLLTHFRSAIKKMRDTSLLTTHLVTLCAKNQPDLLYNFVNELVDIDETNSRLASDVFQVALPLADYRLPEARNLLIRGLLFGEPLSGDLRLENEYATRMKLLYDLASGSSCQVRNYCLRFLDLVDRSTIKHFKESLIEQSKRLSIKKPRYFENSKHHRLKLRIAQALAKLNGLLPTWDEYYLSAILGENNQTNVTFIYELIVAATIPETLLIEKMENLADLPNSGQVSIFATSFLFTLYHRRNDEFVKKLVGLLLPSTLGANFNTRLYAQITIFHLLQRFDLKCFDFLKIAIEKSLKESPNAFERLNTDMRYNFTGEIDFLRVEPILYVTAVPEDEYPSSLLESLLSDFENFKRLKACRNLNKSKGELKNLSENKSVIEDVQRKMNPDIGLREEHTSDSFELKSDMRVIASLIDKLPNLGGIARTCEVLGIRNLVLDSVKHAQNKEFKNLSMTAENWINLSEVKPKDLRDFIMMKKTEGYEIVGAEQTAKSVNFMDFKFPRKCVLLLGHEKEGIPADLIAFLDYAVEIPQFGMVRSLNVHVTGALFMYEYCKQHLSRNHT